MGDDIAFSGRVRRWREDRSGGLAVVDVPAGLVAALGGRRQYRVEGTIGGTSFHGSTMLVAGGGFCIGLSRAALTAAGADVGDEIDVTAGARPDDRGQAGACRFRDARSLTG